MGMDFFGQQHQARKASGRLIWLFVAAVACIVALIYFAAKVLLVVSEVRDPSGVDWPLLGAVAASVIALVLGATLYKSAQLRSGGAAVAKMMGGRRVDPHTSEPQERVLMNVVEEMAIASGVPVPEVFILDKESGVNAFAAGWSTNDAAVAVTQGSLDAFNRDELQGVIAHEFSHIFHGDMRLNIRLMGALFGIICIAVIGRILARSGRRGRRDGQQIAVFGLALIAIGYLGVLLARLIQAAVSRRREYLADAAAVQYTRNPKGIGMALAKIGGLSGKLQSPHADEASHMMFAAGVARLGGSLATHPPIEQRVERVLPGFLKNAASSGSMEQGVIDTAAPAPPSGASGFAGATPRGVLDSVGDPQPQHVAAAHDLLKQLPLNLSVAARESSRVPGIVYSLLLDADEAKRERQIALLQDAGATTTADAQSFYDEVAAMPRTMRLPLLELSIPSLRQLDVGQRRELLGRAHALALSDSKLSPFEFALIKTLERHLSVDQKRPRRTKRSTTISDCADAAELVISVIAHAGAPGAEDDALAAFQRGCAVLKLPSATMRDSAQATPQELSHAIDQLERVSPLGKRNLIHACAEVAAHDGHLDPDEVDLVRALAELWECPVPLTIPA